jgi:hypothetical protein
MQVQLEQLLLQTETTLEALLRAAQTAKTPGAQPQPLRTAKTQAQAQ